ncbi:MAG: MEDS domain-containing protein [Acidobacteriota bacterium]|nr:MEDS domain-containing protein [Acidobacteriota bacterium]
MIYDDEWRRDELIRSFLTAGLTRGERVVYVPERDDDAVAAELEGASDEQLTVLSARDAYVADGVFAPDQALETLRTAASESRARGFPSLRAAGGPPRSVVENGQSVRLPDYERRVQEVVVEHRVTAVCAYDARTTSPRTLLGVVGAHPIVLYAVKSDPRLRIERDENRLVLRGTLEAATISGVVGPIAAVLATDSDVLVDLANVEFIDLSGVRLLVEASGLAADDGRKLVVENTPAWLASIIEMVGFGDTTGLVLR